MLPLYSVLVNKDYQQSVVLLRCDTADVTRRWRGVFSASQKSEHPLVSHLYNLAAQSLVSDVVDHVTIQLRALDVTRLVSHLRVIRDVVQPAQNHGQDAVLGISDGVSRHVSRLETVSKHGFSCLGLGCVSTLVCLVLARVWSFHVSSCLMSRDCVLIVSLSAIAKCFIRS